MRSKPRSRPLDLDPGLSSRIDAAYGPTPGQFRIGLAPIAAQAWLEGGEADPAARKDALMVADPTRVWGETQGSRAGQAEALRLVEAALEKPPSRTEPPLWAAGRLVPDDLCLMEKRDGAWTLTAASLCAGSFFTAAEAVGKPLAALHAPVPGFGDRFLARVARIFDSLSPDSILERRNWSLVPSADLSLPSAEAARAAFARLPLEAAPAALCVRTERQTIRRLPVTGGVLFTIRIWREQLIAVLATPERRAAFSAAWAAAMGPEGADFRGYKGLARYDPIVRELLEP